ncbi:hypothetical protein [Paenibacillus sp. UNC496MF]|uniref:hypothetical protein n=1 Tax=Paenibacillus sp. UNC496MF TaxID=1502753 RepID=UPI000A65FA89|nr:hypothetical protein [Paenibacillus sp. UNC496MF]
MVGKAGIFCGLCILAGGEIGGLLGVREQGYEIGTATCTVIMGIAVLLNQKLRHHDRNNNRV